MQYLDRIAEAYEGRMGDSFKEKSHTRINWICQQVRGRSVLDIGCSQGICEVLLARRGFHILGIDIAQETIDFAKNLIRKEPEEFQNNIQLMCGDFLDELMQHNIDTYDTVLMTELLEHLENPESMIDEAMKHLNDNGRIVVTVPFGINDFPDHKHTFYLADIYEMLSRCTSIEQIEFMGDWIGFVGKKDNQHDNNVKLDINLLKQEERAFWSLERPLRDQLNALNEKYKKAEENYQTAKMWLNSKSIQLEEMKSKLCDKEEIEKELAKKIQENEKYVDQLKKTAIELIQEQQFLKEVKQQLQLLNARYQQIYRQNKLYEEKLNKIYCTWYGKIALKAYKLLKKIKHLIMRH